MNSVDEQGDSDPLFPLNVSIEGEEEKGELEQQLKPYEGLKPRLILLDKQITIDCYVPLEQVGGKGWEEPFGQNGLGINKKGRLS